MVDAQNQAGEKEEIANTPSPLVSPNSEVSLIDKAESIAKKIEEGNKKFEELVKRQEQAIAKQMLAGRADAGQINKTPEETMDAEAQRMADATINRFRRR